MQIPKEGSEVIMDEKLYRLAGRKANILGHENAFKSAVLLPLVDINGEKHLLFEKRSEKLKVQPGEICFPGGAIEKGEDAATAAVRECCEELNLSSDNIELIAALDIFVSPFNAIISPFVGCIKDYRRISPSRDEVEEIFYVPLSFLLDYEPLSSHLRFDLSLPDDYPVELIPRGKDYPFRPVYLPQLFYIYENWSIWGLTARILNSFIKLYQNS